MIITHVNAYNVLRYTCTYKSSNQFTKQGTSELLVYIKKEVVVLLIPYTHPLSYKIPIYIFTKTYTYYRYDEIKFIELILFCKRGKFLC